MRVRRHRQKNTQMGPILLPRLLVQEVMKGSEIGGPAQYLPVPYFPIEFGNQRILFSLTDPRHFMHVFRSKVHRLQMNELSNKDANYSEWMTCPLAIKAWRTSSQKNINDLTYQVHSTLLTEVFKYTTILLEFHTLRKFQRYNKASLGESVPFEIFCKHQQGFTQEIWQGHLSDLLCLADIPFGLSKGLYKTAR